MNTLWLDGGMGILDVVGQSHSLVTGYGCDWTVFHTVDRDGCVLFKELAGTKEIG